MRKYFLGLALLASTMASAQTPTRGPSGYDTGAVVTCNDPNTGGTARCLMPGMIPYGATGTPNPAGTSADPIYVNSGGNAGDVTGTGPLALATANATVVIPLSGGRNAVGLTITGLTGSGATITVERSNNGGTVWTNANTTESSATSSLSATITADGQARVGVAGATNLRLRVSTAGTGTATVAYNATTAAGPVFLTSALPSYTTPDGRIIGGVDNRFINGTAISTGTGTTDAGTQRVTLATDGGYATAANQTALGDTAQTVRGSDAIGTAPTARPLSIACAVAYNPSVKTDGNKQFVNCDAVGNIRAGLNGPNITTGNTTLAYVTSNISTTYAPLASTAIGMGSVATGQVSVGTTATLIRAADAGRASITVIVGAANACAFGNSGVTLTTGYLLPATAGVTDTTTTSAALYGVCSAATTVSYKAVLP